MAQRSNVFPVESDLAGTFGADLVARRSPAHVPQVQSRAILIPHVGLETEQLAVQPPTAPTGFLLAAKTNSPYKSGRVMASLPGTFVSSMSSIRGLVEIETSD